MTISLRTATGLAGYADTATPFDSQTHVLPTGHTTDDLLFAIAGLKLPTTTPSSPAGYTASGDVSSASGQAFGSVDAGDVRAMAWYKVDGGSETAPSHDFTVRYSPLMLAMLALYSTNTGSDWVVQSTTGADSVDTGTDISATGGSLTWATGDKVIVVSVANSDAATDTSPGLTIAGVTVGALTELLTTNITTAGTDGAMYVYEASITAGGTGAPTFTATNGVSGNAHRAVLFIGVTEPTGGAANVPPVANAGADQVNRSTGVTVTLDGTGSTDSDGTIVSYAWTQTAGTTVTLSGASTDTATFTVPTVGADETLTFQLLVTDDDADTDTDTCTVGILAPVANVPPVANAGADQADVEPFATVTLDGTGSTDSDGTISTYAWVQTVGTTVTLVDDDTDTCTFVAPPNISGETLTFQLTVTDDDAATDTDTCDVEVLPHTMWLIDSPMQPLRLELL